MAALDRLRQVLLHRAGNAGDGPRVRTIQLGWNHTCTMARKSESTCVAGTYRRRLASLAAHYYQCLAFGQRPQPCLPRPCDGRCCYRPASCGQQDWAVANTCGRKLRSRWRRAGSWRYRSPKNLDRPTDASSVHVEISWSDIYLIDNKFSPGILSVRNFDAVVQSALVWEA